MRRFVAALLLALLFAAGARAQGIFLGAALPTPHFVTRGVVPAQHLVNLSLTDSPVVCIAGDDAALDGTDTISPGDGLWQMLQRRLAEDNPQKAFTFDNFAIAGKGWADLNGVVASGWPAWYTNHAATWLSYVQAANCDTLFIALGLNDGGDLDAAAIHGVEATIALWAKVPDVVFVTNPGSDPQGADGSAYQIGARGAAALIRSAAYAGANFGVAALPPVGLIDIGRYYQMAVSGIDPAEQPLSEVVAAGSPQTVTAFPATLATSPGGDFDLSLDFVNQLASFEGAGAVVTVTLSPLPAEYLTVTPSGGNLTVAYHAGTGLTVASATLPAYPATDILVNITAKGDQLLVSTGSVTPNDPAARFFNRVVPRGTAQFAPVVSIANAPANATMTVESYAVGKPRAYQSIAGVATVFGATGGGTGGDGGRNQSSVGVNLVAWAVLQHTDFAAPPAPMRRGSNGQVLTQTSAGIPGWTTPLSVNSAPYAFSLYQNLGGL